MTPISAHLYIEHTLNTKLNIYASVPEKAMSKNLIRPTEKSLFFLFLNAQVESGRGVAATIEYNFKDVSYIKHKTSLADDIPEVIFSKQ